MPRLLPFQGISSVLNRLWYPSLYTVSNCLVVINAASHWPPQPSWWSWSHLPDPWIRCTVSARARGIWTRRSHTSQLDGKTPGTCWSYKCRCLDSSVQNGSPPGLRYGRTSWSPAGKRDTGDEVSRAGQRNWGYLLFSWLLRFLTLGLCEHWQHMSHPASHQCSTYLSLSASVPLASPYAIDLCSFVLLGWVQKSLLLMVTGHWHLGHQTHDIRSFSI